MKSLYLLLTLMLMNVSWGQDTTIYMIRHAEKADASADTHLSKAGKQRAEQWAAYFAGKNIVAVYATPYNRTRETAQPLADAAGIKVTQYNPREPDFDLLIEQHDGQSIVMVGHSNTIPAYINRLLGENKHTDIPEEEFGQVFILRVVKGKVADIKIEKL